MRFTFTRFLVLVGCFMWVKVKDIECCGMSLRLSAPAAIHTIKDWPIAFVKFSSLAMMLSFKKFLRVQNNWGRSSQEVAMF